MRSGAAFALMVVVLSGVAGGAFFLQREMNNPDIPVVKEIKRCQEGHSNFEIDTVSGYCSKLKSCMRGFEKARQVCERMVNSGQFQ